MVTRVTVLGRIRAVFVAVCLLFASGSTAAVAAQVTGPHMLRPGLAVRPLISGLVTPISLAHVGADEFLLLEKNTGQVLHVVNGANAGAALDLRRDSRGFRRRSGTG